MRRAPAVISSGAEMLGDGDGAERLERLDGDGKR